ncbi:MAG: U32 family peptidase [Gammaproteobacteria bacterium]|nr:U32 family peptidase [Gammaproteobacteria bacterium]MCP5135353.1 U32 family peptidase [Gammaproteobacteria bacterium]
MTPAMSISHRPRLSLGPVSYYWPASALRDFYRRIADTAVDVVYLGETVCAKRRSFNVDDWLEIAAALEGIGKEVVLSSLTLIEAASEIGGVERLCANSRFAVEANDMAAVELLARRDGGIPFVAGASLNIYNPRTLAVLASQGMSRWLPPVEMHRDLVAAMIDAVPPGVETEVFAYGRLPLAWSARCFTARAHDLPKDQCGFRCLDDPDGLLMTTREGRPFLVANGVQTQSALTHNLLAEVPDMISLGIDVLRISPQSRRVWDVIDAFDRMRDGQLPVDAARTTLDGLMPSGPCNGYWYGDAGMTPPVLDDAHL